MTAIKAVPVILQAVERQLSDVGLTDLAVQVAHAIALIELGR